MSVVSTSGKSLMWLDSTALDQACLPLLKEHFVVSFVLLSENPKQEFIVEKWVFSLALRIPGKEQGGRP